MDLRPGEVQYFIANEKTDQHTFTLAQSRKTDEPWSDNNRLDF